MQFSKRILNMLNEGTLNAISFDDELPSEEEVSMHKISNDKASNDINKQLDREYYALLLNNEIGKIHGRITSLVAAHACQWYREYGALYEVPSYIGTMAFKAFINDCIRCLGDNANLNWINTKNVTSFELLFSETAFDGDISKWDTSNVTSMEDMFYKSSFTGKNGDISNWDTSKVTNMSGMFMSSAYNGDISKWDVSNVEDMEYMFRASQFNGDLSNWDVSKVTDMARMFSNCPFNGDVSKWNTGKVTDMEGMFAGAETGFNNDSICNWDVHNVKNMQSMFVKNITFNLDISKWELFNIEDVLDMFAGSSYSNIESLRKLYIPNGCNISHMLSDELALKVKMYITFR